MLVTTGRLRPSSLVTVCAWWRCDATCWCGCRWWWWPCDACAGCTEDVADEDVCGALVLPSLFSFFILCFRWTWNKRNSSISSISELFSKMADYTDYKMVGGEEVIKVSELFLLMIM